MTTTRYVYVIGSPSGPFKIGRATNLKDRRSGVQTGSPVKVSVIHSETVPREEVVFIERYAHKILDSHRMFGEWFNVPLEDALAAVACAISVSAKNTANRVRAEKILKENQRREALRIAALEAEKKRAAQKSAAACIQSKQNRLAGLSQAMQAAAAGYAAAGITMPKQIALEFAAMVGNEVRKLSVVADQTARA